MSTVSERRHSLADTMKRTLSDYKAGRTSLARLIRDSEAVIESLSEMSDPEWTKELRRQWDTLETIYALMLDEDRVTLTQNEHHDINDTVSALYSMIDQ
jgi:hypothetical protein